MKQRSGIDSRNCFPARTGDQGAALDLYAEAYLECFCEAVGEDWEKQFIDIMERSFKEENPKFTLEPTKAEAVRRQLKNLPEGIRVRIAQAIKNGGITFNHLLRMIPFELKIILFTMVAAPIVGIGTAASTILGIKAMQKAGLMPKSGTRREKVGSHKESIALPSSISFPYSDLYTTTYQAETFLDSYYNGRPIHSIQESSLEEGGILLTAYIAKKYGPSALSKLKSLNLPKLQTMTVNPANPVIHPDIFKALHRSRF